MGNPAKNMRARSRSCCVTAGMPVRAFLAAQQHVGIARQLFKAHIAHREAEVAGRHFFQLVRLVEDHRRGLRQNARVGRARGLLAELKDRRKTNGG